MTLVGCDLHSRKQQVAALDTATGEIYERQLLHEEAPSRSSTPRCPVQSRWALKVPATPSGSMPSWTASGIPCSLAMRRRCAPWCVPGRCSYAFFAKLRRVS